MKQWLISIIVPVYNTKKYLEKCVASLVGQTYTNLEIILVDDGSTDGSGELCDELAKTDNRIKVVHKKNGGLISAWKAGVKESTGEYLNFIDSDDWVDLNMMEEMAQELTGEELEIVASDYLIERPGKEPEAVWQKLKPGVYDRATIEQKVIPLLMGYESRHVTISRCMKLIGRKLIEENMKYCDEKIVMGEDATVMLPSLMDCNRLVIMDHKAYYHYLLITESMSHKYEKNLLQNIKDLQENVRQGIRDKFEGPRLEQLMLQVDKEYIFWLMLVMKNEARGNPKGCYKNIRSICREDEIRKLIKNTPVQVDIKANKLVYLVMKYPNICTIFLLRLAMIVYYKQV